jgi:hypothetical protein
VGPNTYNVPETTLQRRREGLLSRHDCEPYFENVTNMEERVIMQRRLDLDIRGFAPKLNSLTTMANNLLSERADRKFGIKWP